ncbi:hypothetical protein EV356DRAFT_462272 [Viridothelium virens]|uniref:Tr-type G domain-containing protein n=1 Tax=Viridothelium virens TaxID=1048519 RepID=A0A6A6HH64_VIRVR|nr:hypothetical protein EV356DRAFT_462272 [Viridothelium virens]
MASIFTYDPNPPRVSSPWLNSGISTPSGKDSYGDARPAHIERQPTPLSLDSQPIIKVDSTTTRLEAEPQEGPIEYKLHLLLHPRSINDAPGGPNISGSYHSQPEKTSKSTSEGKYSRHDPMTARSVSEASLANTQLNSSPNRSRQQRLEQLTTQLLWRLQQSSPYHASTTTKWTPPSFSIEHTGDQSVSPSTSLIPGLQESEGALYEIGVTDDGTLIGLSEDLMAESIETLKLMAASLGCSVEILRMVSVVAPDAESAFKNGEQVQHVSQKKLWVAEAFVKPDLSLSSSQRTLNQQQEIASCTDRHLANTDKLAKPATAKSHSWSRQVRVSLTGTTMCGKSSLLGTLSTATLDNGRGKSRLSLLKHKHELATGVTSSIAQELIGYHDVGGTSEKDWITEVINFETGDVSSWNDVHDMTGGGRLVLLTDCAGNPRYRRTALRGLIGWAPHWTLLCIPADDIEDTSGRSGSTPPSEEILGTAAAEVDLSGAYLDLCLRLHLPLVVVITKLDLASKQGLRLTLTKVLSILKAANRKPCILPGSSRASDHDFSRITSDALGNAASFTSELDKDMQESVPIVLTSALNGTGIATLHALLHQLPIPDITYAQPLAHNPANRSRSKVLFHVEDEYHTTTKQFTSPIDFVNNNRSTSIIGGHLQRGSISIGDKLVLGPYPLGRPSGLDTEDSDNTPNLRRIPHRTVTTSRSFPGALHHHDADPQAFSLTTTATTTTSTDHADSEWRRVQVVSIRNLRQPVHRLSAGQVGTLGVVPLSAPIAGSAALSAMSRRGMVVLDAAAAHDAPPRARAGFVAEFAKRDLETMAVGTTVLVYVASVRATARIVAARVPDEDGEGEEGKYGRVSQGMHCDDDAFGFEMGSSDGHGKNGDEADEDDNTGNEVTTLLVSFRFDHSREYVETGAQVLIMDAGAGLYGGHKRGEKGVVAGLGGFVGVVVEGE